MEKIQMTREQARELWSCTPTQCGSHDTIEQWERNGFIRKSESQELVEECDILLKDYHSDTIGPWKRDEIILTQEKLIQALKKDHPEFKGD